MNKNRKYCVYMHTAPNEKKYIGITSTAPASRWGKDGIHYKEQTVFYNAIKKYGWENFEHKILVKGLTKEEAEQKEIELIALYKLTDRNYGYNVSNGGFASACTPEVAEKIRIANIGKKRTKETREKISNALKGIKRSDETKRKVSEANRGKVRSKEVKERMSRTFKGRKLTEEAKANISKAKMGEKNPMYGKKVSEERIKKQQASVGTRRVCQYNTDGVLIREWDSIRTASKELGICYKNISRSCTTKYNAGGYKWEYA